MRTVIFDQSTAATYELVAAKTGYRIRVLGYCLSSAGTATVIFKSATTAISGTKQFTAGSRDNVLPGNRLDPMTLFETASGEALNLTLGQSVAVGGEVFYDYVA